MIRIVAGKYRRQLLDCAPGTDLTRPTSDRVRENLFNILQSDVVDSRVLDLFSGTGALGIEALSRGASYCCFVEKSPEAAGFLRRNLERLGVEPQLFRIVCADVDDVLSSVSRFGIESNGFDLVLADPPYQSDWYNRALEQLLSSSVVSKNCTLVIEMSRYTEVIAPEVQNMAITLRVQRDYGKTRIQIWDFAAQ